MKEAPRPPTSLVVIRVSAIVLLVVCPLVGRLFFYLPERDGCVVFDAAGKSVAAPGWTLHPDEYEREYNTILPNTLIVKKGDGKIVFWARFKRVEPKDEEVNNLCAGADLGQPYYLLARDLLEQNYYDSDTLQQKIAQITRTPNKVNLHQGFAISEMWSWYESAILDTLENHNLIPETYGVNYDFLGNVHGVKVSAAGPEGGYQSLIPR